jgi:hypothetical protein
MLKKTAGFLFVSAAAANGAGAFLLEFDNGRNIFIGNSQVPADSLREFTYSLRDDGREIYLALFEAASTNYDNVVPIVALLAPKFTVLPAAAQNRKSALETALAAELYDGSVLFSKTGQSVPF